MGSGLLHAYSRLKRWLYEPDKSVPTADLMQAQHRIAIAAQSKAEALDLSKLGLTHSRRSFSRSNGSPTSI